VIEQAYTCSHVIISALRDGVFEANLLPFPRALRHISSRLVERNRRRTSCTYGDEITRRIFWYKFTDVSEVLLPNSSPWCSAPWEPQNSSRCKWLTPRCTFFLKQFLLVNLKSLHILYKKPECLSQPQKNRHCRYSLSTSSGLFQFTSLGKCFCNSF
jgi:hypothetical protein